MRPSATKRSNSVAETPQYMAASSRERPRRGTGLTCESGAVIALARARSCFRKARPRRPKPQRWALRNSLRPTPPPCDGAMRPYRTGAEHFAHPYARRGQRKSQKNNPSRFSFTMSGRGPQPKFFTKCGNIGTLKLPVKTHADHLQHSFLTILIAVCHASNQDRRGDNNLRDVIDRNSGEGTSVLGDAWQVLNSALVTC